MSISLPHYLVRALGILGFQWPDIDEDQLRDAGTFLRHYSRDARESIDVTHRTVMQDLGEVYGSGAYQTLALAWSTQTRGHMDTLCECCETLADALDVAAVGVEVMKSAVIVQLGIASDEFWTAQALAVETLGASEAALAGLLAIQNRIIAGIMAEFEAEVVGVLVDKTIAPLRAKMTAALNRLLYPEIAHIVLDHKGTKADTTAMRRHADLIRQQAEAAQMHRCTDARLQAGQYSRLAHVPGLTMSGAVERLVQEVVHVTQEVIEKLPHGHGKEHSRVGDEVHQISDSVDAAERKVSEAVPEPTPSPTVIDRQSGSRRERPPALTMSEAQTWRGRSLESVRSAIPGHWTEKPLKDGVGTRHADPHRQGDTVMLEHGWPGHDDPTHRGPYARVSLAGKRDRIPLEGNPVLRDGAE